MGTNLPPNVEIRKAQKLKNRVLRVNLAFTTREFGTFVVKGIRVSESPNYEEIWVQPPSYNVFGKYYPNFFLENEVLWAQIKVALIWMYKQQDFSDHKVEEIDIDEISRELGLSV
jgi:hypothetical protein